MDETQPIPVTSQSPGEKNPERSARQETIGDTNVEGTRPSPVERDRGVGDKGATPALATQFSTPPPPPNWPDKVGWKIGRGSSLRSKDPETGRIEGGKAAPAKAVEALHTPSTPRAESAERKPLSLEKEPPLVGPDATETRPIPAVSFYKPLYTDEVPTPSPAPQSEIRSAHSGLAPGEEVPAFPVKGRGPGREVGREARGRKKRSAMRSAEATTPLPQSRLERVLTLFVLGAAVLMAIGTVAMALSVYQPGIFERPLSLPGSGDTGEEAGSPPSEVEQGTPLGELLADRLPLGTPGAGQESVGGPTIEPGSAIQLTIEPLPGDDTANSVPTSQPTTIPQPTQEIQPTPEPTSTAEPTPAVDPTSIPTQSIPSPEPTTNAVFDPNRVEAEIGFVEKGSSSTGEQMVTVSVYNYGAQSFQVTASDVALIPPDAGNLAPLASSPELPVQVNPGDTVEITFIFPTQASGEGTFKLFTVELDLGDF